ncbi:hypothetical protein FG743_024060 [Salmonella enterica subsp. enterica serovar Hadar]|uniref:hypothetical protein n=1 Tax=Salmonella enterica TaxID=28901 RepID=UPI001179F116|nr:hypothetical protein [Salmonella enterica]TRF72761.1 hypothetical protein FG743_024060 [Salmonella enterica subsp. enterica serovar Hadar]
MDLLVSLKASIGNIIPDHHVGVGFIVGRGYIVIAAIVKSRHIQRSLLLFVPKQPKTHQKRFYAHQSLPRIVADYPDAGSLPLPRPLAHYAILAR